MFRRTTAEERSAAARAGAKAAMNTQREKDLQCVTLGMMVERDDYRELVESMVSRLGKVGGLGEWQAHWLKEAREVLRKWNGS